LEQVLLTAKKLRPMEKPKKSARGWWRYTAQCIINLQRKTKSERKMTNEHDPFSPQFIDSFRSRKKKYLELYKRKMRPVRHATWLPHLTPEELEELKEMEYRLVCFVLFYFICHFFFFVLIPIDQTLIFRSIAMAELKEELKKREIFQQEKQREKEKKMRDSYRVTRWLTYAQSYISQTEEFASDYQLTPEEEKKMLQQLDIDRAMSQMKLPHEYVVHRLSIDLKSVWLNLFDETARVATLQISTKTQIQIRPNSALIGLAVHEIELKPGLFPLIILMCTNDSSVFPFIITKREMSELLPEYNEQQVPKQRRSMMYKTISQSGYKSLKNRRDGRRNSFLLSQTFENKNTTETYYTHAHTQSPFQSNDLIQVEIETNPMMSDADSRILVDIKPIQIVWNVDWVKTMIEFFTIAKPIITTQGYLMCAYIYIYMYICVYICLFFFFLKRQVMVVHVKYLIDSKNNNNNNNNKTERSFSEPLPQLSQEATPTLSTASTNGMGDPSSTRKKMNWKQKRQRQLLSVLAQKIQNEVAVEVNGLMLLVPGDCKNKNSQLLVVEIASFEVSNELPFRLVNKKGLHPHIHGSTATITNTTTLTRTNTEFSSLHSTTVESVDHQREDEPTLSATQSTTSLPPGVECMSDVQSEQPSKVYAVDTSATTIQSTQSLLAKDKDIGPPKLITVKHDWDSISYLPNIDRHRGRKLTLASTRESTRNSRDSSSSSFVFEIQKRDRKQPGVLHSVFETVRNHPHKYETVYIRQQNAALYLFDSIEKFWNKTNSKSCWQSIVDTFSFSMTIHNCVEETVNLPKLFLNGKLPKMYLHISTSTFHTLFNIMEDILAISFRESVELHEPLLPPPEEMEALDQLAGHVESQEEKDSNVTPRIVSDDDNNNNNSNDNNDNNNNNNNNNSNVGIDDNSTKHNNEDQPNSMSSPQVPPLSSGSSDLKSDIVMEKDMSSSGAGQSRETDELKLLRPTQMSDSLLANFMDVNEFKQTQKAEVETVQKKFPNLHFICQFDMESFSLQLTDDHVDRESPHYYSQPIMLFRSEHLWVHLDQTQKKFEGDFRLKSLFIEDLFQQTSEDYHYLVTSQVQQAFPKIEFDEQSEDLIFIHAVSQPSIDHVSVACKFNALHVGWNPDSIFAAIKFGQRIVDMKEHMWKSLSTTNGITVFRDMVVTNDGLKVLQLPTTASCVDSNIPLSSNESIEDTPLALIKLDLEIEMKLLAITLNANEASHTFRPQQSNVQINNETTTNDKRKVWNTPQCYRPIARIINSNTHMKLHTYRKGWTHVTGELGNLKVKDLQRKETLFKNNTNKHLVYRYEDILCLKEKDDFQIGKFDLKLFDASKLPPQDFPGYASKFEFSMNGVKFVHLQAFMSEMVHYVNTCILKVVIPTKTNVPDSQLVASGVENEPVHSLSKETNIVGSSMEEFCKNIKKEQMIICIQTCNPVVIVPRHFMSPEHIKLDLGMVVITNECKLHPNQQDVVDVLTVSTTKASVATNTHAIAPDIAIKMHYMRKLNPQCSEPDTEVDVVVPFLKGSFRHEQYVLFLNTIFDNFCSPCVLVDDPLQNNIVDESVINPKAFQVHPETDTLHLPLSSSSLSSSSSSSLSEHKEETIANPKLPSTMSLCLRVDTASFSLAHDLVNGKASVKTLAKLDVTDFMISNVSRRSLDGLFTVKFGSVMITDERKLDNNNLTRYYVAIRIYCPAESAECYPQTTKPHRWK
ncbi:Ras guanine nucleotide exchange factor, partial [Reticulomyxa filosa]